MRHTILTHALVAATYATYTLLTSSGIVFHTTALLLCFTIAALTEGEEGSRFMSEVSLSFAVNALVWIFIHMANLLSH